MAQVIRTLVLAMSALAMLSACGGGGGNKQPDPAAPPPADNTMEWDGDNWNEKDWQ